MNIIIVGCGKVGYELAKNLSAETFTEVTVIDRKADMFEKAGAAIDAMLIKGDGLSANTLAEAGVRTADLIICVTGADETNILCGISAKRLGAKRTVARVRNPEYAFDTNKFWKELGLDLIINPEHETALEISRLLRFPTADDIDIFFGGRVELVSFTIDEAHGFFIGKSVAQIFHKKKMNVLLAMVERDDAVLIPDGDLVFKRNDIIRLIGRPSDVMDFFSLIGANMEKIKNTVIIGGGKITHYLVDMLQRHGSGTSIKIIEINKEKCEELSVKFPRCLVINGDGTDDDMLPADKSGAIVCLTDRDEENTVIALYSLRLGVRKVIVKINHINRNMVRSLGLGSIVSPKNITSDQIIRYVRGLYNAAGALAGAAYRIFDGEEDKVEAIELTIGKESKCLDIPIKNLRIRKGILIGCIVKGSGVVIPSGDSEMHPGDSVIIIAKNDVITDIDDILANENIF